MAIHGDDVTAVGRRSAVRELRTAMEDKWSVKVRAVLGPRLNDDKRITILGRGVTWKDEDATEYIADPAHREAILKAFDLEEGSKGTVDMGLSWQERERAESTQCDPIHGSAFRSIVARACYGVRSPRCRARGE